MTSDHRWSQAARRLPLIPLLLLAFLLALYVLTLTPGVLGGDVGELQFVPRILSMAHPTGYPLYTLLGKLWTMLPLDHSVAWRMNLLSAVSAGLSLMVIYQLLAWRTGHVLPALAATLGLGLGATFWEQATMADKYAFNALLVSLLLLLTLRWGQTRSRGTLHLVALVYGLSLTHHRTMVLFAPALLGYVGWHERGRLWRDWRRLLRLAALGAAPLVLYLYLPWAAGRNLPPGTWHADSIGGWIRTIINTDAVGYVYVDPRTVGELLLFYARTLQHDFTWAGVVLGLGGLLWQLYRRPADAVFLLASAGLHAFLAANHHLRRQWTFFIPSFIIFALWIGEALGVVWRWSAGLRWRRPPVRGLLVVLLAAAMLLMPLSVLPTRYQMFRLAHLGAGVLDPWRQELKQGTMGERMGRAIAQAAPDAIVVGDWEQVTPLWYYQQVEGWRGDVEILYPIERLAELTTTTRPLYTTRNYPNLWEHWHPSSAGPLIFLRPQPAADLPPNLAPLDIRWTNTLELRGFVWGEASYRAGSVVPLTLYWQTAQILADDYSVSLRLFDQSGQEVFKVDSSAPVLGTYPTSKWSAGEVVGDYYEIQLPARLSPGVYRWGVILYRILPGGGWENLKLAGSGEEVAMGGSFEVKK